MTQPQQHIPVWDLQRDCYVCPAEGCGETFSDSGRAGAHAHRAEMHCPFCNVVLSQTSSADTHVLACALAEIATNGPKVQYALRIEKAARRGSVESVPWVIPMDDERESERDEQRAEERARSKGGE
jgi:hypothetical protein